LVGQCIYISFKTVHVLFCLQNFGPAFLLMARFYWSSYEQIRALNGETVVT